MKSSFIRRVFINPGPLNGLYEVEKHVDLIKMIERPLFRVADTGVSYRTVSILSSDTLLPDQLQEADRGWRNFSIKDYVYLLIIGELKKFGVRNNQLFGLKQAFCDDQCLQTSEALACIFGKIEISVLYYGDGTIAIADTENAALFEYLNKPDETFIKISVNKLLNHVLEQTPIKARFNSVMPDNQKLISEGFNLSDKEVEAVEALRNNDYESITIHKKDNKPHTMTVSKTSSDYSEQRSLMKSIIETLATKAYGDIAIKKRDGRIVFVVNEETIKL